MSQQHACQVFYLNRSVRTRHMEYNYSGITWTPLPTVRNGDCFFHAVFGEMHKKNENRYIDKHALYRRRLWVAFLTFFRQEKMPVRLAELIQNCFDAIDKFHHKNPRNPAQLLDYAEHVSIPEHRVLVEEIPIICTLWNVRVVLFLDNSKHKIIDPDSLLLGKFPFRCDAPLREVVICFTNNHFENLSASLPALLPVVNKFESKTNEEVETETDEEMKSYEQHKKAYPKMSGGAGQHGSDYQVKISSMILVNALRKLKGWKLSTENVDAHPFDDLVLEHENGDILFQIKHRAGKKIIAYESLFGDSGDFSLPKYLYQFVQKIRSRFSTGKLILCTNADLQTDRAMQDMLEIHEVDENSVLHFEGALNKYYTFNDTAIHVLKEKCNISEDDIKDFITRLQFFHRFIDGFNIIYSFKKLILNINLAENLDTEDTFERINKMTLDWFNEESGMHLVRLDAVAMFCNIRNRKYCETFKQYDVVPFKTDLRPLQLTDKQIIHIIPSKASILNIVKLYQTIRQEKSLKALFLNPDDNINIQKQVVDVFSIGSYQLLVVAISVRVAMELIQRICKMIGRILCKKHKKLILIAESENELVQRVKFSSGNKYEEFKEEIRFVDLTELSQSTLSKRKAIVFQGISATLNELLGSDINDFVDADTLSRLLKSEQIEIGTRLTHADKNTESCYISRKLQRQGEKVPEDQFQDLKYLFNEKIVVICDTAGMGKSTILTNLAIQIKNSHPSLFVIRVDLSNCSKTLDAAQRGSRKASVDDLLNSHENTQLNNRFAKNLFSKKANVVLMLDAVDEISSSHAELVMMMIDEAKGRENFRRIFVTTRPHLRVEVERKLNVTAFSLQPLTEDDQKDFLTKYWTHELRLQSDSQKLKCRKYAEALIEEISRWIQDSEENSLAGIPLQTRMLAEVFQENSKLDKDQPRQWEECQEFVQSANDEPQLPERINLIRLYELFVDKKRDIFIRKFGENFISKQMLEEKFEQCHEFHYTLALAIVFFEKDCLLFSQYRASKAFKMSLVRDYVFRVGIVHEVDGSPNFIHRTFAEYFAAKCIVLELKKGPIKDGFCTFLMTTVLTRADYHVVRLFFDSFVQNELESIPDNTLAMFCNINYTCILGNTGTTLLHKIAANGLVGTIKFFFACINFAVTGNRQYALKVIQVDTTNLNYHTPLHEACIQGDLSMAKILVEAGANVNFPDANGQTALHLAAFEGNLDLVRYLVNDAHADVNKMNSYKESVLHSAVNGGNFKVVKFLVEHNCTNYRGFHNSVLHLAVSGGYKRIVKYLVQEVGVDVNIVDINRSTPLHAAASRRCIETVKFLVRHGSNVNAVDRKGNTPCHIAAFNDFSEIVRYLLKHGSDSSILNINGVNVDFIVSWWRSQYDVGNNGNLETK